MRRRVFEVSFIIKGESITDEMKLNPTNIKKFIDLEMSHNCPFGSSDCEITEMKITERK